MNREKRQSQWSALVLLILSLLCIAYSQCSKADNIIELKEVTMDVRQYTTDSRYPLITSNGLGHGIDKGLDLSFNMEICRFLYWDNKVVSLTDKPDGSVGQFRLVGWQFRAGVQVTDTVQIGYYHFSQHQLDNVGPWPYPLEDAVELKVKIFSNDRKPGSVF